MLFVLIDILTSSDIPTPLSSTPVLGGDASIVSSRKNLRCVTTWKIDYNICNRSAQAAHQDVDLIGPSDILLHNDQLWIVNNTSCFITNYDLFGNKLLNSISMDNSDRPTCMAINPSVDLENEAFIIATDHGSLYSYNLKDKHTTLVLKQDQMPVYTSIAIANNTIYLANFTQNQIDVFDLDYNKLTGFPFIDNNASDPIPPDYGPINIVHIGCYLYVLWAKKNPNNALDSLHGIGNGYISVFNLDGSFLRRFTSRGVLNSPRTMIPAPSVPGFPAASVLIGNNGDNRINVFDSDGRYVGPLLNSAGLPIYIEGLRCLAQHYVDLNKIFFVCAIEEDTYGLVGSITQEQIIYY